MSKEELLEFTGDVVEKLPNAMFRVKLENGVEILAHTAGKMRKFRIRVMVGDKVDIEMTEEDLAALKKAADNAGMSIHKYVGLKPKQSMEDGTLEKIAKEIKDKQ